jgi:ectoine hydroxylase-related dioxygenase (phytanoyl-CoA dioxygenase family)
VPVDVRAEDFDALALGDRGARPEELAALDVFGYVVVPEVLSSEVVDALRSEFERLVAADPEARRHELGTRRTQGSNENGVLAVCWRHRLVLEAAAHLLGPAFQAGHGDLRDPEPGGGVQAFHPDHGAARVRGLTVTWFLDAFSEENGPTRLLPGTHLVTARPLAAGRKEPVDGELSAIGPAGSVLLRDARLYHGAGRNRTAGPRRSILVFFQHDLSVSD